MKRLIGLVMLLVGLSGMALGVGGVLVTQQTVRQLGDATDTGLSLAMDSLETALDTLSLTKTTVEQANDSLSTIGETAGNLSRALDETGPLLDEVTTVATDDIPTSLEGVQATIPNLAEVAAAVDSTLRVLSAFSLEQQVFGIPLSFDLGVDYDPNSPLDEAVTEMGAGLDGVPESLRALQGDLQRANTNLAAVSANVETIAGDLETINDSVAEVGPLIDDYSAIITEIKTRIERSQSGLRRQLDTIELIMTALFVWIALSQFVPLYLGFGLLRGQALVDEDEVEMLEEVERERSERKSAASSAKQRAEPESAEDETEAGKKG